MDDEGSNPFTGTERFFLGMAKTRHWQAHVTYPGGRTLMFGVQAASLPAALLKAHQQAAKAPRVPSQVTVTRLYGRHHPLWALSRRRR